MINRRLAAPAVLALALAGCATTDAGYSDGSYNGPYNGGYYAAAHDGSGDYYYDRPEVVVNDYGYGGFYPGFGFGDAPWIFSFGPWYRPWWGYGGWGGWGGPWHHGYVWAGRPLMPGVAGRFAQHPHAGSMHPPMHFGHQGPWH